MTRRLLISGLTLLVVACQKTTEIEEVTSESWMGEMHSINTMMLMTIAQRGTTLSGSGGFTSLLVPGSTTSYTISGTRRADTLDLLLKRPGQEVRFLGWYIGRAAINGRLTGGDYSGTAITLARQR